MPLQIAVGIVRKKEFVLLVHRAKKEGNLSWVFPGGKLEPGEASDTAVIREIQEETGVLCEAARLLETKVHPDTGVIISYWLCNPVDGKAVNAEPEKANEVIWAAPEEAQRLITSSIAECVRLNLGLL